MINGIFVLLLATIIIAFSIQNAADVTISFLAWRLDISLSTLTVTAVLTGIVVEQLLRGMVTKRRAKTRQ